VVVSTILKYEFVNGLGIIPYMMESHNPFMFETKKTVIQYKSGSMKENLHGCMAAG